MERSTSCMKTWQKTSRNRPNTTMVPKKKLTSWTNIAEVKPVMRQSSSWRTRRETWPWRSRVQPQRRKICCSRDKTSQTKLEDICGHLRKNRKKRPLWFSSAKLQRWRKGAKAEKEEKEELFRQDGPKIPVIHRKIYINQVGFFYY